MTTYVNEKGKVFTDVISKVSIPATIQTVTQLIQGSIYVKEDERIKDMLNVSEKFLAVTEATVHNEEGEIIYRCPFLSLNQDYIVWLIPNENARTSQPPGEGAI